MNKNLNILGVFFTLMATDVKKPLPKNFEELNKMNFTKYTCVVDESMKENMKEFFAEK